MSTDALIRPPGRPRRAHRPTAPATSDEALAHGVGAGDERAFELLYDRFRDPLYRYCLSILGQREDAEEALQAALFSAYRALREHDGRDLAVRAWLYRIAHNQCVSALRARKRRPAEPLGDEVSQPGPGVAERVELNESVRQLRRDLAELPEHQRAALVMRELGGLSHDEIGTVLSEPAALVKQLVYQARTGLADLASGREMACADVRRRLSDGDRRVLRGRGLAAHLRACDPCRRFGADLRARPGQLAAAFPVLPLLAGERILEGVLGASASGGLVAGGGATAAGLGVGVAGGTGTGLGGIAGILGGTGAGAAAGGGIAAKAVVVAVAAALGGSTAVVGDLTGDTARPAPLTSAPGAAGAAPSEGATAPTSGAGLTPLAGARSPAEPSRRPADAGRTSAGGGAGTSPSVVPPAAAGLPASVPSAERAQGGAWAPPAHVVPPVAGAGAGRPAAIAPPTPPAAPSPASPGGGPPAGVAPPTAGVPPVAPGRPEAPAAPAPPSPPVPPAPPAPPAAAGGVAPPTPGGIGAPPAAGEGAASAPIVAPQAPTAADGRMATTPGPRATQSVEVPSAPAPEVPSPPRP